MNFVIASTEVDRLFSVSVKSRIEGPCRRESGNSEIERCRICIASQHYSILRVDVYTSSEVSSGTKIECLQAVAVKCAVRNPIRGKSRRRKYVCGSDWHGAHRDWPIQGVDNRIG